MSHSRIFQLRFGLRRRRRERGAPRCRRAGHRLHHREAAAHHRTQCGPRRCRGPHTGPARRAERALRGQRHGHRLEREKRNQNRSLALDEEEGDHALQFLRDENQVGVRDERHESPPHRGGARPGAPAAAARGRRPASSGGSSWRPRNWSAPILERHFAWPTPAGEISPERYAEQLSLEQNRQIDRVAERRRSAPGRTGSATRSSTATTASAGSRRRNRGAPVDAPSASSGSAGNGRMRARTARTTAPERLQALMWQREATSAGTRRPATMICSSRLDLNLRGPQGVRQARSPGSQFRLPQPGPGHQPAHPRSGQGAAATHRSQPAPDARRRWRPRCAKRTRGRRVP